MPIQLQTPDRFVIYVSDMQRSVAFYRDTLGLPLKFSSPGWSEFNNGGTTLALHRHMGGGAGKAEPAAGQASLVFALDDLQGAYATLQAEGVNFSLAPQTQPSGQTFAVLHDPDGFSITLQQRQAHAHQ
ncbi:MAG TPA: VOC family protein [Ktedonobacteraceae bacterium]